MYSRDFAKDFLNSIYGSGRDIDGEHRRPMIYSEYYTKRREKKESMEITNVIFNDPATIVFWSDGTKTVVKCQDGDVFDPEKGLAMAISKKAMGNKGSYFNVIDKWTEKYEGPSPIAVMLEKFKNNVRVKFEKP